MHIYVLFLFVNIGIFLLGTLEPYDKTELMLKKVSLKWFFQRNELENHESMIEYRIFKVFKSQHYTVSSFIIVSLNLSTV